MEQTGSIISEEQQIYLQKVGKEHSLRLHRVTVRGSGIIKPKSTHTLNADSHYLRRERKNKIK